MYRISRSIWKQSLGDVDAVKALALIVCVKNKYSNSLITNFSINKVAKLIGKSHSVAKRLIDKLEQMNLIQYHYSNGELRAVFCSIRNKKYNNANINIELFKNGSYDEIIYGLKAMVIKEYAQRKEYIKQQTVQAINPRNIKQNKTREKLIKAGVLERCENNTHLVKSNFVDSGLSYKTISNWIGGNFSTVSKIINFGVKIGLFIKEKVQTVIHMPKQALNYVKYNSNVNYTFATRDNIILIGANKYHLCSLN